MRIFANSINFTRNGITSTQWETRNQSYILTRTGPSGTITYIQYELEIPNQTNPNWFKVNSDYIDFNLSKLNIEKSHTIDTAGTIDEMIENLITNGQGVRKSITDLTAMGCVFNSLSYAKYMTFVINLGQLTVSIINDYDLARNCFSMPFFKSILDNNRETNFNNCFFTFVNANIDGATIALKVSFSNGQIKYYDYTNNPPYGSSSFS